MKTAIISDIHGNLEAFTSVLADIQTQQTDGIVSLGDNIGYGADSEEVLQLLIAGHIPTVLGNHEMAVLDDTVLGWHRGDVRRAIDIAAASLSEHSLRYLRESRTSLSDSGCRFVHGFPPDSFSLYLHQAGDDQLRQAFTEIKDDLCFVGHTHKLKLLYYENDQIMLHPLDKGPVQIRQNRKYLINVGSVGQPRDGDVRARYVIWDSGTGRIEVRAVEYDAAAAARKIIAAGIPSRFAALLQSRG
ncbi:MAG: metallophosphoesterase family protein [Thermodesulfobacteriota bacterium]